MSSDPLVTAIIPAFNSELTIGRAIRSVLSQTLDSIECIVVDDGSQDNTAGEIQKFGDKVVFLHQDNAGASVARNTAISRAKGEFIAFLDADDYWVSTKLANQLEVFRANPAVGLVSTDVAIHSETTDADSIIEKDIPFTKDSVVLNNSIEKLIERPYLGLPTVMVRTTLLREIGGFDENLVTAEDIDMYLKMCWSHSFAKISQELTYLEKMEDSLGNRLRSYRDNLYVIDRFAKLHPDFSETNKRLIDERKLYIYSKWIRSLLYFGFGQEARMALNEGLKVGPMPDAKSLRIKSYYAFILAWVKGRKYKA